MAQREQPQDYNAFGYDPRGRVVGISGLMFGEDWRPNQENIPCYRGSRPEVPPPRYGPPADYQQAHLPNDFVPQFPHDGYLGALGVYNQQQQRPWLPPPLQYVPP